MCNDCERAAIDHAWGGYRSDCYGCTIRAIATSPKHIREAEYRLCKPEELPAFKDAVAKEYERVQKLRKAR